MSGSGLRMQWEAVPSVVRGLLMACWVAVAACRPMPRQSAPPAPSPAPPPAKALAGACGGTYVAAATGSFWVHRGRHLCCGHSSRPAGEGWLPLSEEHCRQSVPFYGAASADCVVDALDRSISLLEKIPFAPGSAVLGEEAQDVLKEIAAALQNGPDLSPLALVAVVSEEETDSTLDLARARADVVLRVLSEAKLPPSAVLVQTREEHRAWHQAKGLPLRSDEFEFSGVLLHLYEPRSSAPTCGLCTIDLEVTLPSGFCLEAGPVVFRLCTPEWCRETSPLDHLVNHAVAYLSFPGTSHAIRVQRSGLTWSVLVRGQRSAKAGTYQLQTLQPGQPSARVALPFDPERDIPSRGCPRLTGQARFDDGT